MAVVPMMFEVSVPFSNSHFWQGIETAGRVRVTCSSLVLEFQAMKYKDTVWPEIQCRAQVREVAIPLDEVESVDLLGGWLHSGVEIKARSLKPLPNVPGSQWGKIRLTISNKNEAKELVLAVADLLRQRDLLRHPDQGLSPGYSTLMAPAVGTYALADSA